MRSSPVRMLSLTLCLQGSIIACEGHALMAPGSFEAELSRTSQSSGLSASPVSWSEIDLAWQPGAGKVSGFEVSRSTSGVSGPYSVIGSTAGTVTGYADAGLTPATAYCYEIRSSRTTGRNTTFSDYSSAVCATTLASPVGAPTGTSAVPAGSEAPGRATVRVTWSDNSTNENGFRVETASSSTGPWTQAGTTGANATSWGESYALPEIQVCYRVIAFKSNASSLASAPDCTTPPAVPSGLSAASADQRSITVTWKDNSTVEDGYSVSRLVNGSAWTEIATLPANTTSYRDADVAADVSYTYRLFATKDGGFSGNSNEVTGVISASRPSAPLDAYAEFVADVMYGWEYFDLVWRDQSANEAGFRIEYSPDGASGWETFATVDANVTVFSVKLDLFYPPPTPANGCYRVIAFNSSGDSAPSNVACAEWREPPTDLVARTVDQQSIDLSWVDHAGFEAGYRVYRARTSGGAFEEVATLPPNSTRFRDTGLASNQQYWYYVAVDYGNGYGDMDYSDVATATTSLAPESSQSVTQSVETILTWRGR